MANIIKPSPYPDGSYQRKQPMVVLEAVFNVSRKEHKAIKNGKRGCSCDGSQLADLGQKCVVTARHPEVNAKSWSIYPIPGSDIGIPKVVVKFHNWPQMGMCNFKQPVARKNYWWDERPLPNWMTGDENGPKDPDGHFDTDA